MKWKGQSSRPASRCSLPIWSVSHDIWRCCPNHAAYQANPHPKPSSGVPWLAIHGASQR
ncbi:Uncharacterised protein [Vibrio cholerae]|nr:Uncharacterised protein [Vibrio cholerae]